MDNGSDFQDGVVFLSTLYSLLNTVHFRNFLTTYDLLLTTK